ncbi:MAG: asparagine--tRNA ligase [Candidatus Thorarchaeota archaeon]|nr:MAG: asparagine--tRNA ligase [Candidatus Thorarchaeota archaeon]
MSADRVVKIRDVRTPGETYSIRGWVYRKRIHGKATFIVLRDETGVLQCVHHPNQNPQVKIPENLGIEASVQITGIAKEDKRAPGGIELEITGFKLIGPSHMFPITKDQSIEILLDLRHLWLRSRRLTQIMQVKAEAVRAAREWFHDNEFVETFPPILVGSACEGGATLFSLKYFDRQAYLSQSAQLYLEALIFSLGDVYSITPSFRAEKSRTVRHLTEYWHIEAECPYKGLEEIMQVEEQLFAHICNTVAEKMPEAIRAVGRDPDFLAKIKAPFKRITYEEAVDIVHSYDIDMEFGEDFGARAERALSNHFDKPFFIYRYPEKIKPFYVKRDPDYPGFVLSADLMAPEGYGEMTTGGAREEDLDSIVERIKAEGFNPEDYSWYLDLRRYGSVPHAGFGLGTERLVWWMLKLDHIRDACAFPRVLNRVTP